MFCIDISHHTTTKYPPYTFFLLLAQMCNRTKIVVEFIQFTNACYKNFIIYQKTFIIKIAVKF